MEINVDTVTTINPDTLTLGELAIFEAVAGTSIEETVDGLATGAMVESASFLVACVLVASSRQGEPLTVEQASQFPFAAFGLGIEIEEEGEAE